MGAVSGKRFLMEVKKAHGNSRGVFLRLRQHEEVTKESGRERTERRNSTE